MPRKSKELGALAVGRLTKPGRWSVGGVDGLALQVTESGARSWVLRMTIAGKRREMGLGSFPTVTLAGARDAARVHRAGVSDGVDPITQRDAAVRASAAARAAQRTFDDCCKAYLKAHEAGWKNAKHAQQWRNTLEAYAAPVIGQLLVRDVTTAHVLQVIEKDWATKNETMNRTRQRIEVVLDWAAARGYRDGPNPARWRGHLDKTLPRPSKVAAVKHHTALPLKAMGPFMKALRVVEGMGARALEFVILTAARSGEARGATWREIDLPSATWTIAGERMKAGRQHRVPLSAPAIRLLKSLPRAKKSEPGHELVFPSTKGTLLSDMTLSAVLRRMKVDAVPHGFRSTFRDWGRTTGHSEELMELALAHAVGSQTQRAYARDDALEARRPIMVAWATLCQGARPITMGDQLAEP